jgi:hypothetical protein
VDCG